MNERWMSRLLRAERTLEAALFASRWLLAPFYAGLAISLVVLLCNFALSTVDLFLHGIQGTQDHLIIAVLGLIDLSLMANLVLIVIFAGYENFVGRMDQRDHPDRPSWMGHVGFSELKLKLMASIVAISAIHLLEDFMNTPSLPDRDLAWRAGLHVIFVVSALLLALMDRVSSGAGGQP